MTFETTPEAPINYNAEEAAAWESGWTQGWESDFADDAPEAPIYMSNFEASAWQSGWTCGNYSRHR